MPKICFLYVHLLFRRYIKDTERKELLEHATSFCVQSFKNLLKKHSDQRNDNEILTIIIDIFKAHKKLKNASQKESPFSNVLTDAYKLYAEGKARLQENVNYLDSANKFCVSLTNGLKNQEKQQPLTGIRQTLEELALKNFQSSLPKTNIYTTPTNVSVDMNTSVNSNMIVNTGNLTPTGAKIPAVPKVISLGITPTTTAMSITTVSIPASTTMISTTTMATTAPTVVSVPTGRRGRPPGSKNSTTKADAKNAAMQQKLMASILQPLAGSLSSLDIITAHLDPAVKSTVLGLIAEPNFMKTLAMFPDPTGRNTLLREYFSISKYPNIQQYIDGFNSVFNYLASVLQPQTSSLSNVLQPPMTKPPKAEKAPLISKSSSMSIFPTTSKPHPSLSTSPSKPNVSSSISATITPVPSPANLLKPGESKVISVGSGQLTITPSISITPNPTKTTLALPQMPAPSFNIQKQTQPKQRRSTGEKTTKASQKMQRLSQGTYPELAPISIENLPKSLSIIPSPNAFQPTKIEPNLPTIPLPINVDLLTNKPVKQQKPKKKSLDANKAIASQSKIPLMDANLFKKSMAAQFNTGMGLNFLSHYEQFLSGVPPASLQLPIASKSKQTSTVTAVAVAPQQKPSIKVKKLDQLQGRQNTPKVKETQGPKAKQSFQMPNISNAKNPPVARSPAVLNAYGTTISSIPIPSQPVASSFTTMAPTVSNLATNLQIRYV